MASVEKDLMNQSPDTDRSDRHRGALWVPTPPQLSLASHPPAPLQAHHRYWAADPQTLWLHRGNHDIIHTTPAARVRQTWSVVTGEKHKLTRL